MKKYSVTSLGIIYDIYADAVSWEGGRLGFFIPDPQGRVVALFDKWDSWICTTHQQYGKNTERK